MSQPESLNITTPSDREIVLTRDFHAPRHLVYQTLVKPDYIRRWLLGPPGWEMVVCNVDLRVGGAYRYQWRNEDGKEMAMGGVYREIVPDERIVCTEKFDDPWYEGEAVDRYELVEKDGVTTMTMIMDMGTRATRDLVLKSGIEKGLVPSYQRLDELLETLRIQETA